MSKTSAKRPPKLLDHSETVNPTRPGIFLRPYDERKRKFLTSAEYTRPVLDPAIDSSETTARFPGRLVSRKDRRLLWSSLELYRKKKRQREAREARQAVLSSPDSIITDSVNEPHLPRKRAKRSPPSNPQESSTSISDSCRSYLMNKAREVKLETQHYGRLDLSNSSN